MTYSMQNDVKDRPLSDLVAELPPDAQAVVRDFVEFLLSKRQIETTGNLRQDWAGVLRGYREQYTATDLQKQSLNWRSEG